MSDDLTNPLWGTGHGSKRHLVDMATFRPRRETKAHEDRRATAMCTQGRAHGLWLDYFADESVKRAFATRTNAEIVASRLPCARCQKIADREAQS